MVNLRFMLVVVALTLGFVSFGCSQSPSPEPTPSANQINGQVAAEEQGRVKVHAQWWRDESTVAKLELSDDQVQAIDELMTATSEEGGPLRKKERQLSLRYLRALSQEPYDPALADRVSERLIEVMSSEQRRRMQNVRALRDILTQEQFTKLWEVAPRVLQIGRFRALRGPKISVTDATPTPTT